MELSESLAGRRKAKPKDIDTTLFIHRNFLPYNGQRHCACHLDLIRTQPDAWNYEEPAAFGAIGRHSANKKWETAMLEIATHLFAAGLLSGCAPLGVDACNFRPAPTDPSRLQYALEHQPKVAPNECFVLGADYVWRACQGVQLVFASRR